MKGPIQIGAMAAAAILFATLPAAAQFSAGSSGVHGAFPPGPIPATGQYLLWNMSTGLIRYCSAYDTVNRPDTCTTEVGTGQIQGIPPGGLLTGVFEFTNVNVIRGTGSRVDVFLLGNIRNNPLTILSQDAVQLTSTFIWADGSAGAGNTGPLMPSVSIPGGRSGPGGFAGGAGAPPGATVIQGNPGFGPAGGAGSVTPNPQCGNADINPRYGGSAGASPLVNALLGGSGGGGGSSSPSCGFARTHGSSGGGGGGAVLIAANNLIAFTGGSIDVTGGNAGTSSCSACLFGGAGAAGMIRLTATTITGTPSFDFRGGNSFFIGSGAGGVFRVDGNTTAFNPQLLGVGTATITGTPTEVTPPATPILRITTIADTAVPPNPAGVFSTPDVILPTAPTGPVAVALAASNIPVGTTARVRVTPQVGAASETTSTALTGTVADSTATAQVTLPPGYGAVTAAATFACTATLCARLTPLEREGAIVEVIASADGASRAFIVTAAGARIALD